MEGLDHYLSIESLFFSADSKYIFVVYADTTIMKWETKTFKKTSNFQIDNNAVGPITLSRDRKWLATESADNSIKIWDIGSKQIVATLRGHASGVFSIAFSPNGKQLAVGYRDNLLAIWDLKEYRIKKLIHTDIPAYSTSFFPSGKRVLTTSADIGRIGIWDLKLGRKTKSIHSCRSIQKAIFSPGGNYIATVGDSDVSIWTTNGFENSIQPQTRLLDFYSMALSPNEMHIATIGINGLIIWDMSSKKIILEIKNHFGRKDFLSFSPTGKYLTAGTEQAAWIIDTVSGSIIERLEKVQSLSFSPSANRIAVKKSGKNTVVLRDILSQRKIASFTSSYRLNHHIVFSPDGKRVATGNSTNLAEIWNAKNGEYVADLWPLPEEAKNFGPNLLSFSRNGKFQAREAVDSVQIWDMVSRRKILSLDSAHGKSSIYFSPCEKRLALVHKKEKIKIWDIKSKKPIHFHINLLGKIKKVDFFKNGKRIAILYENSQIKVHDIGTQKTLFDLHENHHALLDGTLSADGKMLALLFEDGGASVWQIGLANPKGVRLFLKNFF